MIDVKHAVDAASNFLVGLYANNTVADVRLEEVELSEDDKHWLITLSFQSIAGPSLGIFNKRQYKVFKVDADTGKVVSMKIRELSHATP